MRIDDIIGLIKDYFFLAFISVIVLGIIFLLLYFVVYKQLFGGKKNLSKLRLFLVGLFISYVIMVIGVTFMNRGPNYQGGMELSLFSSYREAWYSFSTRHWQFRTSKEEILRMIKAGEFMPYYESLIQFLFDGRKLRGSIQES